MKPVHSKNIVPAMLLLLLWAGSLHSAFIKPEDGSIIHTDICTLWVSPDVTADSISFSISYLNGTNRLTKKGITTLTTRPYRILYNISSLPNQYYRGARITAWAYVDDTIRSEFSVRNLFFQHQSTTTDTIDMINKPFSASAFSASLGNDRDSIHLSMEHDSARVRIHTELNPPDGFHPDELRVLLAPHDNRPPYPDNGLISFRFRKERDEASLVSTYVSQKDGSYSYPTSSLSVDIPHTIHWDRKTITADILIPPMLIGGKIPDNLGVNTLFLSSRDTTEVYSLVQGSAGRQKSPAAFPVAQKTVGTTKKVSPLSAFFAAFAIGTITGLLYLGMGRILTLRAMKNREQRKLFREIVSFVDRDVTKDRMTLDYVRRQLSVSPGTINRAFRALTGHSFREYVTQRRIEMAKERLISSYSSEISIAKDCSFRTVGELESTFRKYAGLAPYQYREFHQCRINDTEAFRLF
ncbi:MAG: helix-turn-helix domain-containing protein [Fibrobacterota bacterium]